MFKLNQGSLSAAFAKAAGYGEILQDEFNKELAAMGLTAGSFKPTTDKNRFGEEIINILTVAGRKIAQYQAAAAGGTPNNNPLLSRVVLMHLIDKSVQQASKHSGKYGVSRFNPVQRFKQWADFRSAKHVLAEVEEKLAAHLGDRNNYKQRILKDRKDIGSYLKIALMAINEIETAPEGSALAQRRTQLEKAVSDGAQAAALLSTGAYHPEFTALLKECDAEDGAMLADLRALNTALAKDSAYSDETSRKIQEFSARYLHDSMFTDTTPAVGGRLEYERRLYRMDNVQAYILGRTLEKDLSTFDSSHFSVNDHRSAMRIYLEYFDKPDTFSQWLDESTGVAEEGSAEVSDQTQKVAQEKEYILTTAAHEAKKVTQTLKEDGSHSKAARPGNFLTRLPPTYQ